MFPNFLTLDPLNISFLLMHGKVAAFLCSDQSFPGLVIPKPRYQISRCIFLSWPSDRTCVISEWISSNNFYNLPPLVPSESREGVVRVSCKIRHTWGKIIKANPPSAFKLPWVVSFIKKKFPFTEFYPNYEPSRLAACSFLQFFTGNS